MRTARPRTSTALGRSTAALLIAVLACLVPSTAYAFTIEWFGNACVVTSEASDTGVFDFPNGVLAVNSYPDSPTADVWDPATAWRGEFVTSFEVSGSYAQGYASLGSPEWFDLYSGGPENREFANAFKHVVLLSDDAGATWYQAFYRDWVEWPSGETSTTTVTVSVPTTVTVVDTVTVDVARIATVTTTGTVAVSSMPSVAVSSLPTVTLGGGLADAGDFFAALDPTVSGVRAALAFLSLIGGVGVRRIMA